MTNREKFEREDLLRLERGELVGESDVKREYDRLKQAIAAAAPEAPAGEHWKQAVLESVAPVSRWKVWLPAAVAATLAVVLLGPFVIERISAPAPQPVPERALTFEISDDPQEHTRGGPRGSGDPVHRGSKLTLHGSTSGERYAELRVYRFDDELVRRCSDQPPCERDGNRISTTLVLERVGDYYSVLLVSAEPIAEPSGSFDRDVAAATDAGAQVEPLDRPIRVQ